ncbi:MAG TPA: metallophosphatase [Pelotomaculum sp.]|nr:metallophosphatase [Pelotomaculum sp.]
MRILHTADWHLGEFPGPVVDGKNARLMDTVRCIDFLVEKAMYVQPDAILIAGDLFHKSQQWANPMLNLIDIAASRLRQLAAIAPTVLMFGTANHDNLQAFENIRAMRIDNLYIITTPYLFTFDTKSGPLQIAAVPGLDKGYFRTKFPGMDPAEENQKCSELLGDIVLGLGAQVDTLLPSVLMTHYSVAGCEYDNGQQHIFTQSEVILQREAIAASPFDLVCLGHIHKAQEVEHCGRPVFYSGAINGLTFNEEGQDKGFWIHDVEMDSHDHVFSRFINTPYREFLTEKWDDQNIETFLSYEGEAPTWLHGTRVKDKIIRIHYECSDELNKQLNRKVLEKSLYEAGAFYVAEVKPVQIITALTKQELSENAGPMENLRNWCRAEGFTPEETLELEILARPLIDTVSSRMPTGKLSGVFEPRRLEVKNYRSYREASFDFSQVNFAVVGGPNGIGKSAFFMDAISDCLYEETREGELTGWITNGEKSGAITFEFSMGESIWRVIRTRARSGKTTVALQEQIDGQWVDRSAEKVRDTQEKIVALLGMDALTFRCCGIIMQDAYGLFLEADREDRMQVLGNILGLGIYEQLETLAKAKVTDANRELQKAKDKLADLDEKLKALPGLKTEQEVVEAEIKQVAANIESKTAELKGLEETVRTLEEKQRKAEEFLKQMETLNTESDSKVMDRAEQIKRKEKAQLMLDREPDILTKAAEYDRVKQQIAVLETKEPRLKELSGEENQVLQNITRAEATLSRLGVQIRDAEYFINDKDLIEQKAAEYTSTLEALNIMDGLGEKHKAYHDQVVTVERTIDASGDTIRRKRDILKIYKDKLRMLDDANCIDSEKASCRFLTDAIESKAKIPQIEAEIVEIEKTRTPLIEQVKDLEALKDGLGYSNEEHYRLKKLIEELRPYSEKALQLSAKAELLDNLNQQQTQRQEELKSHKERLASVKEWARALAEELKPLAEMRSRLPKLESWAKAKDQLPAAREILKTAGERIKTLDTEIAAKTEQAEALELRRADMAEEAKRLPDEKYELDATKVALEELREKQSTLQLKAGGLKAKLEALAEAVAERALINENMGPQAVMLTRYQTLAKSFGQDGIPFSIIRTAVPELSTQANEILGQMTGGKMSLEMRTERIQKSNKKEVNALEIFITDYQWGTMPYKSRSGGQKVRAALSVAFALAELKARRAGIQLGMLFVDEPSFLDAQGSEAYCDALEAIAERYAGMKVVAISHDPAMKARFPQMIEVEDGGEAGSRVRLVA